MNTMICIAIPVVLQYLILFAQRTYPSIENYIRKRFNSKAKRRIIYRYREDASIFIESKKKDRNDLLQKAVTMYIAHLSKIDNQITFEDADIFFMTLDEEKQLNPMDVMRGINTKNGSNNSQLDKIKRLQITSLPSRETWAKVKNDIYLLISEYSESNMGPRTKESDSSPMRIKEFYFEARNPGGIKRIDSFLEEAKKFYVESLNQEEDNSRYLYVVQNEDRGGNYYNHYNRHTNKSINRS